MRHQGKSIKSALELLQMMRRMKEGQTLGLWTPDGFRVFKLEEIRKPNEKLKGQPEFYTPDYDAEIADMGGGL